MNKTVKIISVILFGLVAYCNLYSQTYFNINQALHQRADIDVDSIFQEYESPKLPDEYKSSSENFMIGVYVLVDTNCKVSKLQFYPFYSLRNKYSKKHKIWRQLEKEIRRVSKNWIFKPVLWYANPNIHANLNRLIEDLNSKKGTLPRFGRQEHFIVFHFDNFGHNEELQFLYQLGGE